MKILWPNGGTTRPNLSAEGHFGWRNASTPGASKYHRGQDMWGIGTIRAIADGTVVFAGWGYLVGWGGGYQVWIQHDGFFTRSLHMRDGSSTLKRGDHVHAGDPIGTEGHTGTYVDHLHLEVTPGTWHTRNDGQVDPVPFIEARITTGTPAGATDPQEDDMQDDERTALFQIRDELRELLPGKAGVRTQGATNKLIAELVTTSRDLSGKIATLYQELLPGKAGAKTQGVVHQQLAEVLANSRATTAALSALAETKGLDPKALQRTVEAAVRDSLKGIEFTLTAGTDG